VSITGDISFTGAFSVDGSIKGNVYSEDPDSTLILGEKGYIIGDANVANIYANGRIDGNVIASNKVELHQKARINGDLYYNLLEMAVGAGVNGKLLHQEKNEGVESANLLALEGENDVIDIELDKK
jgi:cytoskeletal protein CcmA (bactofilin family)